MSTVPTTYEIKELENRLRLEYAYHKSIMIKITENIIGGLSFSVFLLCSFLLYKYSYSFNHWQFYVNLTFAIFGVFNSIRFLKDEFSLLILTYQIGRLSQQPIIHKLQQDCVSYQQKITLSETINQQKTQDKINVAAQSALRMIKLFYQGHKIDKESCKTNGLREIDWLAGRELLVKAGLIDMTKTKSTILVSKSYQDAKNKLKEVLVS